MEGCLLGFALSFILRPTNVAGNRNQDCIIITKKRRSHSYFFQSCLCCALDFYIRGLIGK
jgi:hypothetical protein